MFKVKYLPLLLAIIAPLIAEEATLPPSFMDILGKHSDWFNEFSNITTFTVKVEDASTKSIEDSDRRESLDESQPRAKSSESIDHSELIEPSVHIEKIDTSQISKRKLPIILDRNIRSTETPDDLDSKSFTNIKITDFVAVNKIGIAQVTRQDKRFKKRVNFEEIDHSILGLLEVINGLDPNLNKNEYTLIQGKKNSFRLMNFITHHSLAKTQCEESESSLVDIATFEEENLKVDRKIILADVITVVNNRLYCKTSDGSEINELACV